MRSGSPITSVTALAELWDAYHSERLVVFAGPSFARLAGMPSLEAMLAELASSIPGDLHANEVEGQSVAIRIGKIEYELRVRRWRDAVYETRLLLDGLYGPGEFSLRAARALSWAPGRGEVPPSMSALVRLVTPKVKRVMTTSLDDALPRTLDWHCVDDGFGERPPADKPCVILLHGTRAHPQNWMCMRTSFGSAMFGDDDQQERFRTLWRTTPLLFAGFDSIYPESSTEDIETIFHHVKGSIGPSSPRHHAFLPKRSSETPIARGLRKAGVEIVEYLHDAPGAVDGGLTALLDALASPSGLVAGGVSVSVPHRADSRDATAGEIEAAPVVAVDASAPATAEHDAADDRAPSLAPLTASEQTRFGPHGRYVLLEALPTGTLGQVWRASDTATETGEVVALKILHRSHGSDPNLRSRVRRALIAMMRLQELAEWVVHISCDSCNDGEVPEPLRQSGEDYYFVMTWIPFQLHDFSTSGKALPEASGQAIRSLNDAVQLVVDTGRTVAQAHELDLVHGNIHPRNVLLDEEGNPYLCDFGLGRRSLICASMPPVGAGHHVPPEWDRRSGDDGFAADVLGLALLVPFLLTGQACAPTRRGLEDALTQVKCPPGVKKVLVRAIEPDPTARYDTAEAFCAALLGALSAPVVSRAPRQAVRRPLIAHVMHPAFAELSQGPKIKRRREAERHMQWVRDTFVISNTQTRPPDSPNDTSGPLHAIDAVVPEEIDAASIRLWVRGLDVTDEERDARYIGNFAVLSCRHLPHGKAQLSLTKLASALNHPQRARFKAAHPNWGHPILRQILRGKLYETAARACGDLQILHEEYPDTSILVGTRLHLIVFGRRVGARQTGGPEKPKPVHKYVLYLQSHRRSGMYSIAYKWHGRDQQSTTDDEEASTDG